MALSAPPSWEAFLNTVIDPLKRDRWAHLRFSIIGPLLAAPPDAGNLRAALTALAARSWRHPDTGRDVSFGVSTLERWYYTARAARDPVAALKNRLRSDIGRFPSLSPHPSLVFNVSIKQWVVYSIPALYLQAAYNCSTTLISGL